MSRKGLYPFVASLFIVVDTLVYFMFQDSDNGIAIHPWLGPSKLTGKLKSGLGCASNLNPFEYLKIREPTPSLSYWNSLLEIRERGGEEGK